MNSWLQGSSVVSCTGVCLTIALDDDGGELKKADDDDDDDGTVALVNDTVAALVDADDDFGVDLTSSTKFWAVTYITALARGVCSTIAAVADTALVDPEDDDNTALVDEDDEDDEDEDTFAALAGDEDEVGDDDDDDAAGAAGYLFDIDDDDDDDDADWLL